MRYRTLAILLTACGALLPLPAAAGPGNPNDPNVTASSYFIRQLTYNDTDDEKPVISGNNVAWWNAGDQTSYPSVMLRNPTKFGVVNQQLGSHTVVSQYLNIWGDSVVFSKHGDIHISDGTTITNLSLSPADVDDHPQIWGTHVLYLTDYQEIKLWDGQQTTTIPGQSGGYHYNLLTGFAGSQPGESNIYNVYKASSEVWAYNVDSQQQTLLTDPNYTWTTAHFDVNGDHVVWSASYSDNGPAFADLEIYGYHLGVGPASYEQITQSDTNDYYVQTGGQDVTWSHSIPGPGSNDSVMINQNGTTSVLAQPGYPPDQTHGAIDGSTVAWTVNGPDFPELHVRSGAVDYDFSTFSGDEMKISGKNLVWSEWDGNDSEIWAAFFGGPEAVLTGIDLSLMDLGGLQLINGDLRFTSLRSALIQGTNFSGSDLTGATGLEYAIGQAIYSHQTILPEGFNPLSAGWSYVTPEPRSVVLCVLGILAILSARRRPAATR